MGCGSDVGAEERIIGATGMPEAIGIVLGIGAEEGDRKVLGVWAKASGLGVGTGKGSDLARDVGGTTGAEIETEIGADAIAGGDRGAGMVTCTEAG